MGEVKKVRFLLKRIKYDRLGCICIFCCGCRWWTHWLCQKRLCSQWSYGSVLWCPRWLRCLAEQQRSFKLLLVFGRVGIIDWCYGPTICIIWEIHASGYVEKCNDDVDNILE